MMSERPEKAMEWLRNVGVNGYWTHPDPPITVYDQAKARRNEILKELMNYIAQLEASLAKLKEAKADSKRLGFWFKRIKEITETDWAAELELQTWFKNRAELDAEMEYQDHD